MQYPHLPSAGAASTLPLAPFVPTISVAPLIIPSPNRRVPLQVRITFPASTTLTKLPILIFSHGGGPSVQTGSLHGYAPLREFFASHGFLVIQPTHLESKTLGFPLPEDVNELKELYMDSRAKDISAIIDNLLLTGDEEEGSGNVIEQAVPAILKGKLDTERIVMAGHSFGAYTTSTILGTTNINTYLDAETPSVTDVSDKRVKIGVIFAGTGSGTSDDLSDMGRKILPFYNPDFSGMGSRPALVVYGDQDVQPFLCKRDAEWHVDPYRLGGARKTLLGLKEAKHGLGGIAGWDLKEADDDDQERLWVTMGVAWGWVWKELYGEEGAKAWEGVREAMKTEELKRVGWIEEKE